MFCFLWNRLSGTATMVCKMNTFGFLLTLAAFVVACGFAAAAPTDEVADDSIERIINGATAKAGQIPYQASLRIGAPRRNNNTITFSHICGASVINKRWVLTAAHCIDRIGPQERLIIVLGTIHIREGGDRYPTERIIIHPKFNENIHHDIGLVKSKRDFVFNARVRPIALSRKPVPAGLTAVVSGWGDTKANVSQIDRRFIFIVGLILAFLMDAGSSRSHSTAVRSCAHSHQQRLLQQTRCEATCSAYQWVHLHIVSWHNTECGRMLWRFRWD